MEIIDVKLESNNTEVPVEFENTYEINDGGYEKGFADGSEAGKKEGYDKGFDNGLEQGYNDGYSKGSLPIYYAGYMVFNNITFPENTELVLRFKKYSGNGSLFMKTQNLKSVKIVSEEEPTVTSFSQLIRESTDIEVLDLSECMSKIKDVSYMAMDCKKLKSILGAFDFSNCTSCALWLHICTALEDISFVPNTIKISIQFSFCDKLTAKSIQSIIDGLADLTGQTSQKITWNNSIIAKLTAEQATQIYLKNWEFG